MCTHKAAQETFNLLVDALRLAVKLGMTSGAHAQNNARSLEKLLPKRAGKDTILVRDDG